METILTNNQKKAKVLMMIYNSVKDNIALTTNGNKTKQAKLWIIKLTKEILKSPHNAELLINIINNYINNVIPNDNYLCMIFDILTYEEKIHKILYLYDDLKPIINYYNE